MTQTTIETAEAIDPSEAPTTAPTHTVDLLDALRNHYLKFPDGIRQGDVFLTEVTAPNRVSRADAIRVGLWASRGYTVDVHELKTSRSDFQRELDNPAKAEAWWPHSNTFWIVAPSTTVAPPELLPPGWGLMVPGKARRFKVVVKAEHRDLQPTTALMAALLVSMETDLGNALERQRQKLDNQRYQAVQEARRQGAVVREPRLKYLELIEQHIGFRIDEYSWDEKVSAQLVGSALRDLIVEKRAAGEVEHALKMLDIEADRLKKAVAEARKTLGGGEGR